MYGYSQEDLRVTLRDMGGALTAEPTGSMGNDFALAVLSDRAPALYSYFKQLFAQVTNPPVDPIRERVVMSLETAVGPQSNLFESSPEHAHQLIIGQPLLRNFEIEKLKQVDHTSSRPTSSTRRGRSRRARRAWSARWSASAASRQS